ncbi:MAG TPA: hypothetical protein VJ912_02045 [Candidatus Nanoarchaeia archaeon]|nr:hypothetical protein [Candidatus Nanoarchaeia archaeon]
MQYSSNSDKRKKKKDKKKDKKKYPYKKGGKYRSTEENLGKKKPKK